jgi:hypothetical protein
MAAGVTVRIEADGDVRTAPPAEETGKGKTDKSKFGCSASRFAGDDAELGE